MSLLAVGSALPAPASEAGPAARPEIKIEFAPPAPVPVISDRTLLVNIARNPATIDGNLDDACWQQATKTTDFYSAADDSQASRDGRITTALLCHSADALFIGIICQNPDGLAPPPAQDSIELLFDSVHDEQTFCSMVIRPDQTHTDTFVNPEAPFDPASGGGTQGGEPAEPQPWDSGASIAWVRGPGRWTAELSIPKASYPDPQNALWGFNMVRRTGDPASAGKPATVTTWNKIAGDPRRPEAFGHLAFEMRPCYIKAAGLGFPHRGTNTLNVAIVNQSPINMELNALIIVRQEDGKQTQNRYKFPLNTGEGQWLALDFPLDICKSCSIEFDLFDARENVWLARFTRRAIAVKPMIALEKGPGVDKAGPVVTDYVLNVPAEILGKASLSVTLRATTERATRAFAQTGKIASTRATVTVAGSALAPGVYLLRATIGVVDVGSESCEATFTIPQAQTAAPQ